MAAVSKPWRRVLPLVLAVGLAVAVLANPSDERISEIGDRPLVIATLPCDNSLQATSSGFVIEDETVMTVAHAIFDSRDFAVRDASGQWHSATVEHMDLERDLAVLHVAGLRANPMDTRLAAKSDDVRMLSGAASGTTAGEVLRRVRITTEVIGDRSQTSMRSGYELSIAIKGGDSGAAVIDGDDRLVGLVFARSTRRDATWATSVTEIVDALDGQGSPTWECERQSDAELYLEPLQRDQPEPVDLP